MVGGPFTPLTPAMYYRPRESERIDFTATEN